MNNEIIVCPHSLLQRVSISASAAAVPIFTAAESAEPILTDESWPSPSPGMRNTVIITDKGDEVYLPERNREDISAISIFFFLIYLTLSHLMFLKPSWQEQEKPHLIQPLVGIANFTAWIHKLTPQVHKIL